MPEAKFWVPFLKWDAFVADSPEQTGGDGDTDPDKRGIHGGCTVTASLSKGDIRAIRAHLPVPQLFALGDQEVRLDDGWLKLTAQQQQFGLLGKSAVLDLPENVDLIYSFRFHHVTYNGAPQSLPTITVKAPVIPEDHDPAVDGPLVLNLAEMEWIEQATARGSGVIIRALPDGWDLDDHYRLRWFAQGEEIGQPRTVPFDAIVADELGAQVPDAVGAELASVVTPTVTAEIEARPTQIVADPDDATHIRLQWGDALSPPMPGSATTYELVHGIDEGVKRATGGIVPIERFSPDEIGFAAALLAAINEADAQGGVVTLESGKTYTAQAGVSVTDKHARINFNGARIIRSTTMANAPVLELMYSTSTPQAVLGITTQEYDNYAWSETLTTPVSRIEVASTAGWAADDLAVIISDDALPNDDDDEQGKCEGERVRIASVAGNFLYTYRPVRANLVTNVRIARMTVRDIDLNAPWTEDAPGSPASRNAPGVAVYNGVQPRLTNPRARHMQAEAVRFAGCVRGVVDDSDMHDLRTSPADGAFGYGFRLSASCDFDIYAPKGSNLRHLTSTTSPGNSQAHPTVMWRWGGNYGHRIVEGSARECGNAGFDTHAEARFVEYDKCYVGWNHRQPFGGYPAFALRGSDCTIRDSVSIGPCAVFIHSQQTRGNHRVINHSHTTPAYGVNVGPAFFVDYSMLELPGRGSDEVSGRVHALDARGAQFRARRANVRIPKLELVIPSQLAGTQWPVGLEDSALDIDTLTVDITGSAGTIRLFDIADSLSSVKANRLIVRTGGLQWSLGDFRGQNGSISIGRLEADTVPIQSATGGMANPGATATYSIGEVVINGQSLRDGIDYRTNDTNASTGATATLSMFARGTQVLNVPITTARTITHPARGRFDGERREFIRTAAATGASPWTIGGETLTPGTRLTVAWSAAASAWVTVGKGTL